MSRGSVVGSIVSLAVGFGAVAGGAAAQKPATPVVRGSAQEGAVLKADRGRSEGKPLSFSYQWRRCLADGSSCTDIARATDEIYTPSADDVGRSLRVVVTARTRGGASAVVSAPTTAVAALPAAAPHNTALPAISGSFVPGQVLSATPGTWTGTPPLRFSYRWRRCDRIGGSCTDRPGNAQTYRLSARDAGHALRVLVVATNSAGTGASLSAPSAAVAAPAKPAKPANTSLPTISGVAQEGRTLTGSRGAWGNQPTDYTYRWLRCNAQGGGCVAAAGGVNDTLTRADVGHTIRFAVTARNSAGSVTAVSAPTGVVSPLQRPTQQRPQNTSPPTISGAAREGQTLTGNRGGWANNPTDYDYSWRRCDRNGNDCDGINGAHATTYRLTGADVGHTVRFRVEAKNAAGKTTATSAPTAVVTESAAPASTSPPTISGTPQEGKTLTGNRGSWTHNPTDYDYSWLRCDRTGGSCAALPGANGTSHGLTSGDVGTTLRFRVVARNSAGSSSATSVPTAVVTKAAAPAPPPPPRPAGCPARTSTSQPANVAAIAPPARLLVDAVRGEPAIVRRATQVLVVRVHVTSTCGGPVQGALVYATATPYNQFSIPPEAATGGDGWATLVFRRLRGFPVSPRQQLIAMFVRARKPGDSLLAGISSRRLVSLPVDLR